VRTLVWFRGKDLRVTDHPALHDAVLHGEVVPLFVLDPYFFAAERAQRIPHRMQFLLASLVELERRIKALGSRLWLTAGSSVELVPQLASEARADRVVASRWCEPFARERDRRIAAALTVPFQLFEGETLHPPGTLRSQAGTPFAVFSAFARAHAAQAQIDNPLPAPSTLPPLPRGVKLKSVRIPSCQELGISPNPALLPGGEGAAEERLTRFLKKVARRYDSERDRMDLASTSRLSADLKFGTLSVRRLWHAAEKALQRVAPEALRSFKNELLWREFSHSTLWDRPELLNEPFRPAWRNFPWRTDEAGWQAWTLGKTGYPVVDAAARQLLSEGFVHNRARMIAASFLTKHLLIDYRRGEQHYLRYLTDGDWAQNNAGWQWCAGSGCDAQPYFRVFNPITQGRKFDPEGDYVRRLVPELARLPARYIHAPFAAPQQVLDAAGVRLGFDYPLPIVEHSVARSRFLAVAHGFLGGQRAS
jgi:deoxyribodipyrimidine photo-lyase